MRHFRSATACLLAAILQANPAFAANEELAVQEAIRDNYAAYSGFDEARYRATTTDDFLLLEQGELIDREGDVALMPKPGTGFRRTDHFEFNTVKIIGDVAYAVYVLKSDITDDARGTRVREWLESAFLRHDGSRWKMALLHSTRVTHPAGASDMRQFGVRYAAAWSARDPAKVAAFFAENASLTINDGTPSVGRAAIADTARSFMVGYPDLVVEMSRLDLVGDGYVFRWNLAGTNAGTGCKVRISGYEEWTVGADGLVAKSVGHYDPADWDRQLGDACKR
ncbi:MAG: nuclear transport factor 2 family protein [Steroidobacteraceae bacterium]